eukprot:gnl/TRDRNA2_/TRDRNA2_150361_c0_seq2.p1 gnl/TRDRNA2_/TRDRNA2_150361_c0~~gnl/TRDRNA2_/TRDRNA2_150361_c0_seq2.p1  ORF type:complete len:412 (+),score=86.47 gnl/TRDRNA2_/TRDRNA2_150361_c0_seq2:171-1238(+)
MDDEPWRMRESGSQADNRISTHTARAAAESSEEQQIPSWADEQQFRLTHFLDDEVQNGRRKLAGADAAAAASKGSWWMFAADENATTPPAAAAAPAATAADPTLCNQHLKEPAGESSSSFRTWWKGMAGANSPTLTAAAAPAAPGALSTIAWEPKAAAPARVEDGTTGAAPEIISGTQTEPIQPKEGATGAAPESALSDGEAENPGATGAAPESALSDTEAEGATGAAPQSAERAAAMEDLAIVDRGGCQEMPMEVQHPANIAMDIVENFERAEARGVLTNMFGGFTACLWRPSSMRALEDVQLVATNEIQMWCEKGSNLLRDPLTQKCAIMARDDAQFQALDQIAPTPKSARSI